MKGECESVLSASLFHST